MMPKVRAAVLFAAFGGANAGACSGGACTFLSDGRYCPVNDVREHADINKDVAEVAMYLRRSPPAYADAMTVYENGVYSSKGGNVMRTLRDLARKVMTVNGYTNDFYTHAVSLHGSTDAIFHQLIDDCLRNVGTCNGKSNDYRTYVINKGLIGVVTAYVTYEMGAALKKAADGNTGDYEAAYAWDEAAAFHIGRKELGSAYTIGGTTTPGSLYSPWEFNWKRDSDFPNGVQTHALALPIFNFGLVNLRGNAYNRTNLEQAQADIYKIYAITAIRSAIKYGWKAYGGGTFSAKYLAEGALYFRSASGYLSKFNSTIVQEVTQLFGLSRTSFTEADACSVKTKLESMYTQAGISCDEVGAWRSAPTGSCVKAACTGGSVTLTAPNTNYVAGCTTEQDQQTTSSASAAGVALASVAVAAVAAMA